MKRAADIICSVFDNDVGLESVGKELLKTMNGETHMAKKILIVDDDKALSEMLSIVLQDKGFDAVVCQDGLRAVDMFPLIKPDLILLDVMLPGMDGIEVAKTLRAHSGVPIIMLMAKTDTLDVVTGLEAGADDYVTKPFNTDELLARINARLRGLDMHRLSHNRASKGVDVSPSRLCRGSIVIDRGEHTATKNGVDLGLTPVEFDLCFVLAANEGKAITREDLLRTVWGYENSGDTRLVNVHVQRLRAKVESDVEAPNIIQTVRGIGYRFVSDDESGDVQSKESGVNNGLAS